MGTKQTSEQKTSDNRLVTESGSFGNTGKINAGNITLNELDGDLVKAAYDFLGKADALVVDSANRTMTTAANSADNLIQTGAVSGIKYADLGKSFADSLLVSAENAREDSFKAGNDAISSAFNAVSDLTSKAGGQTFDYSQLVIALVGAGALFLVTKH